jgi:hypothetical protein
MKNLIELNIQNNKPDIAYFINDLDFKIENQY